MTTSLCLALPLLFVALVALAAWLGERAAKRKADLAAADRIIASWQPKRYNERDSHGRFRRSYGKFSI